MSASVFTRSLVALATTALVAAGLATPAAAQGNTVGGSGSMYYLNDAFSGKANIELSYGDVNDMVYFGDWDGNGTDTPMVRRGGTFYVRNSNTSGAADVVFSYGDPGDVVIAGDWDGNGTDTLAVRRGNTFYVKNTTTTGVADRVIMYGDPGDTVLVGDWDGDRVDTLMVRRGGQYFVKNSISTGVADRVFYYGDPGDTVMVGNWDGVGGDSLAVRRGNLYYLRNALSSGTHDLLLGYGNPDDTSFAGDWNGDGTDTLGVRRPPVAPQAPFGDGTHRVGVDVKPGTYRSAGPFGGSCYWERVSGFGGSFDEIIANDYGVSHSIVTIAASDRGFTTRGCGSWRPVEQTYPASPVSEISDFGTYVVNRHIQPGTYTAPGGASCYWERVDSFDGEFDSIIANDATPTNPMVTIASSDAGFSTRQCGTWRKI